jgi:hypothetical protein
MAERISVILLIEAADRMYEAFVGNHNGSPGARAALTRYSEARSEYRRAALHVVKNGQD